MTVPPDAPAIISSPVAATLESRKKLVRSPPREANASWKLQSRCSANTSTFAPAAPAVSGDQTAAHQHQDLAARNGAQAADQPPQPGEALRDGHLQEPDEAKRLLANVPERTPAGPTLPLHDSPQRVDVSARAVD